MDGGAGRVALIEVLERDGRVRHALPVAGWPLTIGRAYDNDLVLDDPHVAAHHARIETDADGRPVLTVLPGAHNAVTLEGRRVGAGAQGAVPRSAWSIGGSSLRLRWAGEALEAERPLPEWRHARGGVALALLLWAMVVAEAALVLDPGAPLPAWLAAVFGPVVALGAWAALWGLASKLFRHRFEFWRHGAVAVRWLLAMLVLRWAVPVLTFVFSWSWLPGPASLAIAGLGAAMLGAHLQRVLPGARRAVSLLLLLVFVAGAGVQGWLRQQATGRWFAPLYASAIAPPVLRLAPAMSSTRFIEEARALQSPLQQRARADRDDADAGDEED